VLGSVLGTLDNLSEGEQADFFACEEVLGSGWDGFVQCGLALARIRDGRLYRQQYDTFEAYCRQKWQYGRVNVHRLISAAQVFTYLLPNRQQKPEHETQVRPLVGLTPEQASGPTLKPIDLFQEDADCIVRGHPFDHVGRGRWREC
jgi:hypothetical protein